MRVTGANAGQPRYVSPPSDTTYAGRNSFNERHIRTILNEIYSEVRSRSFGLFCVDPLKLKLRTIEIVNSSRNMVTLKVICFH